MYRKLRSIQPVRTLVGACLYYSGLVPLLRWRRRRQGQRLIILTYHRAAGDGLRGQLLYLQRHYRLLPLEVALEELSAPRSGDAQQQPDQRTTAVLTFDDGYRDNYTHLFPLVCELGIPVTIFLIPGYIDSGDHFWWLEGERLVRRGQASAASFAGRTYHLDNSEEREALTRAIDAGLRYATSIADREAFLASIREALAVPPSVAGEELPALPLTWAQVREMEASGWVSYGAHTMHHPVLACLRDPAEVEREIGECRMVLEQQLGHPVRTLAYPIGHHEHLGEYALEAVRAAGYRWAAINSTGVNTPQSDPLLLRRIGAEASDHWLVLAARVAGVRVPGLLFAPKSKTRIEPVHNTPSQQTHTAVGVYTSPVDEPVSGLSRQLQ